LDRLSYGRLVVVVTEHASDSLELSSLPTASGGIARLAFRRCADAGIKSAGLLRKAGLSLQQICDRKFRPSVQSQIKFLTLAGEALGDDLLGFHLGQSFDLREIGLLYYVMASSDLLGVALQRCAHYSAINNEGVRLIFLKGEDISVRFEYKGVSRFSDRHQIEFFITTLIRICRQLSGARLRPQRVTLTHVRPVVPEEVRKDFGCAVLFGAKADEICWPKTTQTVPVISADPFLSELLQRYCDEARATRATKPDTLRSNIENLIVPLLPHEKIQLSKIASKTGMSKRTLGRRLAFEGLTFAGILHDLRYDLAKRYLKETGIPISTVAWLLGYEQVSAFTHAFKRWTNMTPRQARSQQDWH
jgi:AraC-like DNA-binding protein